MDFLRAHHDGQLIGANTLREEPGTDARGADYGIDDEQLQVYRGETLGFDKQKIIVLTGSGNIDVTLRVFDSSRVEPWIVTSAEGEKNLRSLKVSVRERTIKDGYLICHVPEAAPKISCALYPDGSSSAPPPAVSPGILSTAESTRC